METKFEDTVAAEMTKNPITIDVDRQVVAALKILIEKDIGSLVVTKKGQPIGIITERDVTRRSLQAMSGRKIYDKSVTELMSSPLTTVTPTTPIWETFEIMLTKRIRSLPVMEGERLVGIVTDRDLFKWLVRIAYAPNIPARIKTFLK
jgi:CBS domain-containing protein